MASLLPLREDLERLKNAASPDWSSFCTPGSTLTHWSFCHDDFITVETCPSHAQDPSQVSPFYMVNPALHVLQEAFHTKDHQKHPVVNRSRQGQVNKHKNLAAAVSEGFPYSLEKEVLLPGVHV